MRAFSSWTQRTIWISSAFGKCETENCVHALKKIIQVYKIPSAEPNRRQCTTIQTTKHNKIEREQNKSRRIINWRLDTWNVSCNHSETLLWKAHWTGNNGLKRFILALILKLKCFMIEFIRSLSKVKFFKSIF